MGPMASITRRPVGDLPSAPGPAARPVEEITIRGDTLALRCLTLGGHVTGLEVAGRAVVLSLPDPAGYADPARNPFMGALVGRYANRIAGSRFTLDGEERRLEPNEGPHHLHGGPGGLQWRIWQAEPFEEGDAAGVALTVVSPDGDGGYPGELRVAARYTVSGHTFTVDIEATTDAPTVVNLTSHCYWNLAGGGTVRDHLLAVAAARYLEVDEALLPSGLPAPVPGTPLDLRTPRRLGDVIDQVGGNGLDHCYVLDAGPGEGAAARLTDPGSGRWMEIRTDQPGLQVYTGGWLGGGVHPRFGGVCLEAQRYPDAPNHPDYPSAVLRPGDVYRHHTEHRFGAESAPATATR